MINDRLQSLVDYPFRRLADLLAGVAPPDGVETIDMAIGEPRHPVPALVPETLAANAQLWGRYPPTQGTPAFRAAVAAWLSRRFALPEGMIDAERHVLPCNGTREALFTIALLAVPPAVGGKRPVVLMPDPFYQVYAGAAVMAGAEPVFVAATAEGGFLPDFAALPEDVLARTALAYLCTPANPQGTVAGRAYLAELAGLARRADFVLAIDACYCDIYTTHPPIGIFEACSDQADPLDHVIAFHSLSKRSSVPGLRSGFVAGDAALIAEYARLRAYTGGQTPLPVLAAATALWGDETHVEANRALYQRKFAMAAERLEGRCGFYVPPGGFYLWLEVGDGEAAAKRLWCEAGLRVMSGGYLSRGDGADAAPGAPYIRIALVHDLATTEAALDRLERALAATVRSGAG